MSQNSTASLSAPCYRLPQIVGVSWSISLKAGAKVETFYLYTNYFDGFFQNIFKQFHLCLIIKNFIYQKKRQTSSWLFPENWGGGDRIEMFGNIITSSFPIYAVTTLQPHCQLFPQEYSPPRPINHPQNFPAKSSGLK